MTEPPIELRPANGRDVDFIARLIELTMRAYVEATWGAFDPERTRRTVAQTVGSGHYSIVRLDGRDIGALAVEREASHIQLAQIYVLPAHQNRGIGTALVRRLAEEARAAGKPLRVRVLAVNPVRRLYEREGFAVTSETPERVLMEWRAG